MPTKRKTTPKPPAVAQKPAPKPPAVTQANVRNAGISLSAVFLAACIAVLASKGCTIDLTPTPPAPPTPPPVVELDPLTKAHLSDRSSKIRILKEMAAKMQAGEFKSDQAQADWWQAQMKSAMSQDFKPFTDATAESIIDGTVNELADQLEVTP